MKKCNHCNQIKHTSDFNKNKSQKDGLQTRCRECQKITDKKSYQRKERKDSIRLSNSKRIHSVRTWIIDFLSKNPCSICGETDILTLQFDHLYDKTFSIAFHNRYSLSSVKKEVSKCRVLCANCHQKHSMLQSNNWRLRYKPL